jgi:hypothetical protein
VEREQCHPIYPPTLTKIVLFLHQAREAHLAFNYMDSYPNDLIYPTLSSELKHFFDQNGLSVPCSHFINELISLSELWSSPPRLFEILICKLRGSRGRPGALQIGMEDGLSTESLTYQKMEIISMQYFC